MTETMTIPCPPGRRFRTFLIAATAPTLAPVGWAQSFEPDADLTARQPVIVNANVGNDYVPTGVVTLADNRYEIRGNLIVRDTAQLRIRNALVEVRGDVRVQLAADRADGQPGRDDGAVGCAAVDHGRKRHR